MKLGTGLTIATVLIFGAFVGPAQARWGDRDHRPPPRHENHPGYRHDWNGGYYRAPPVVYEGRYNDGYGYYPPPVVYGPGIGITLPGINIGIH